METLDISKLTKNENIIKQKFKVVKDMTLTTDDLSIVFPVDYTNRYLAALDEYVEVVCIFAILDNKGNYASTLAPIKQRFYPSNIEVVNIEGVKYYKLDFSKNGVFFNSNKGIQTMNFVYDLFNMFILLGKVPWYVDYISLSNLIAESSKYNGNNIGNDVFIMELIASIITKYKDNPDISYRHVVNTLKDIKDKQVTYKGLDNHIFNVETTSSRLIGGHLEDNLIAGIIDPTTNNTKIENILIK